MTVADLRSIVEGVGGRFDTATLPPDLGSPHRTHVFLTDDVVVKLDREDGLRTIREHEALELLAGSTIPAPAPLGVGRLDHGWPWVAMSRLGGTPSAEASRPPHLTSPGLGRWLGEQAARLHSEVTPPGFGTWTRGSATLIADDRLRRGRMVDLALRAAIVPADEVHALGELLDASEVSLASAPERPALVHRDLQARNVLVDGDGRPAAIIDFESAGGSDPAEDFNRFGLDWHASGFRSFLEGYRAVAGPLDEAFADRVAHHTLMWTLIVFAYVGGLDPTVLPLARAAVARIAAGDRPDLG